MNICHLPHIYKHYDTSVLQKYSQKFADYYVVLWSVPKGCSSSDKLRSAKNNPKQINNPACCSLCIDRQITAAWTATSSPLAQSSWWPSPVFPELETPGPGTSSSSLLASTRAAITLMAPYITKVRFSVHLAWFTNVDLQSSVNHASSFDRI